MSCLKDLTKMPYIKLKSDTKEYEIPYKVIKRKNARRITLSVKSNNSIVVSGPKSARLSQITDFVNANQSWLSKNFNIEKFVNSTLLENSRLEFLEYKVPALRLLRERVEHFNQHYQYEYNKITIRDQSSRWGSCSTGKNLNFNYRLYFLPEELRDYVVVHEICHLKEMNHSYKFWALVFETIPNYKVLRKKLRKHELELF